MLMSRSTWNQCTLWGAFSHIQKIKFQMRTNWTLRTRLSATTVIPAMLVRLAELSGLICLSIGRQLRRQAFPALFWQSMHGATTTRLTGRTNTHILSVKSRYCSSLAGKAIHIHKQSVPLHRDRGCLFDMYNLATQWAHPTPPFDVH